MLRTSHTLPPLSPDEQRHSERLIGRIRDELALTGNWMGFDRFMHMALYEPGLGYYSAGAHKLGRGGDFTTAPELSILFSQCLGEQVAQMLQTVPSGDVLELGAGSGVMAVELLRYLAQTGHLPGHYLILDVSADLRERQKRAIEAAVPELSHRVQWVDRPPEEFYGIILGNEVLDALPCKRFQHVNGVTHELGVQWQHGLHLVPSAEATTIPSNVMIPQGGLRPTGFQFEVCMQLPLWMESIAKSLRAGYVLLIDYGLPATERYAERYHQGTFSCFFRQLQHDDALQHVGLQDMTYWVDFTQIAQAGVDSGLELAGFCTQAQFLIGTDIHRHAEALLAAREGDEQYRWRLSQQIQQLMLPEGMGEIFKVMAFSRNCEAELRGFSFRDLRHRL